MKKILIVDIGPTSGGVEKFVDNIFDQLDKDHCHIDFLIYGDHCYHEEKYSRYGNLYKVSRRYDHPFKHFLEVKHFFKENNDYDIVWIQTRSCSNVNAHRYARKFTNAGIITHSHAIRPETKGVFHRIITSLLIWINKKTLLKCTDYAIGCSYDAYRYLFGKYYKGRGKVVLNGVDLNIFRFDNRIRNIIRNEHKISNDCLLIGHVGRMVPTKNHKFIIDVLSELKKRQCNSAVLLVGDGPDMDLVKAYVKEKNLEDSVVFTGEVSNPQDYYSAFDIFMLPSLFEGMPLVTVEAQAEGLQSYISDSVPRDVVATDYIYILNLDKGASFWAETMLENREKQSISREAAFEKLQGSVYDINETVKEINEILTQV